MPQLTHFIQGFLESSATSVRATQWRACSFLVEVLLRVVLGAEALSHPLNVAGVGKPRAAPSAFPAERSRVLASAGGRGEQLYWIVSFQGRGTLDGQLPSVRRMPRMGPESCGRVLVAFPRVKLRIQPDDSGEPGPAWLRSLG